MAWKHRNVLSGRTASDWLARYKWEGKCANELPEQSVRATKIKQQKAISLGPVLRLGRQHGQVLVRAPFLAYG